MTKRKLVFITCLSFASMASIVCHAHDENIASLMQQLEHKAEDVRKSASKALMEMGEVAVPALILGLNHENAIVREKVVGILHVISRERAPRFKRDNKDDIVRALVKALKDDDRKVRFGALTVFLGEPELPPEVISGLVQLLYYGSPFYDPSASEVLLSGGRGGEGVNPQGAAALIEALHSGEWSLRFGTALAYSFGIGRRHLNMEFRNKRNKEKPPSTGVKKVLKEVLMPLTGEPPSPGTAKAVVATLVEGLTHPDWKTRELVMGYLKGYADDFDEARKALDALPPFGITFQTIGDEDYIYYIVEYVEDYSFEDFLNALNTDGITFKFNRSIHGNWKITIQPVDGEPLGWNVEKSSHTLTIKPPEGKELVKGQRYMIQLRNVKDILHNQVDADIEFSTEVPLHRAP